MLTDCLHSSLGGFSPSRSCGWVREWEMLDLQIPHPTSSPSFLPPPQGRSSSPNFLPVIAVSLFQVPGTQHIHASSFIGTTEFLPSCIWLLSWGQLPELPHFYCPKVKPNRCPFWDEDDTTPF